MEKAGEKPFRGLKIKIMLWYKRVLVKEQQCKTLLKALVTKNW